MTPENAPEVADQSVAPELSSDDILAELATMREAEEKPEVAEEAPAPVEDAEDAEESDDDEEDDDLDEDDDEDEDSDEEEEEDEPADKGSLTKKKAEEKSFRKFIQSEKAKLQAEKDEWTARVEAAEQSLVTEASLKSLMFSSPVSLAERLGVVGHESLMALGKYYYQQGKGMAPDAAPADKLAAEASKRQRDQSAANEQTQSKVAELARKIEAKDQAADHQREIQKFKGKLERIAAKKFPLAAKILGSKAKEEAQESLIQIAREIVRETDGEAPSAKKVLKRYEAAERRRLEARGIDVDAYAAATKTKKTNPEKAAKTKPVSTKPTNENNSSDADDLSPEDRILRELQEARERGEVG